MIGLFVCVCVYVSVRKITQKREGEFCLKGSGIIDYDPMKVKSKSVWRLYHRLDIGMICFYHIHSIASGFEITSYCLIIGHVLRSCS